MPGRVPPSDDQLRDLEILIQSHHALLLVETVEDERLETLLRYLAARTKMPLLGWQPGKGLRRLDSEAGASVHGTESPAKCLAFIENANQESLYHLRGFSHALEDPEVIVALRDIHRRFVKHRGTVVLSGAEMKLPPDLELLFTPIDLGEPTPEAYHQFISAVLRDLRGRRPVDVAMTSADVSELLSHLRGLTFHEVRRIVTEAVVEDGKLDRDDIRRVIEVKKQVIERSGVLEYFPAEHAMADVAGLEQLKSWLRKRHAAFANPDEARRFGLEPPKGLLLLGVQGCGKSLCAKAVATEWRMPLLRLDPANLYQKFFGETEKNFKRATELAEKMAPVVLWIDEIEKAFAQGGDRDGGTSRRVFGSFLSWLQDKKQTVFVLATSNDISKLPAELLRKGRFDEIFFVDLPEQDVRRTIFEVHLRRRNRDPGTFDLDRLAGATQGWSGAEIEQAVISALYTAFSEQRPLDTELLLGEVAATRPLSVTKAEDIDRLRAWAESRAIPA